MTRLDRHALAEEREWRLKGYRDAVRQTVSTLVDAIQTETRRALEREVVYDDDLRYAYTYAHQAAEVQHAIIQALNNADFRSLTRSAADLHVVEVAAHSLASLRDELPVETQAALAEREDEGLRERIAEKAGRLVELDERDARLCQAAVHQSGRGVGFHRCQKNGTRTVAADVSNRHVAVRRSDDELLTEVRLCSVHLREFEKRGRVSLHVPSDWEAKQNDAYRAVEERRLARMRERLAGELVAPEAQKEVEG